MEVQNIQHQIIKHKEAKVKRGEIQFTTPKQQNQAISVHRSTMVAKKFILQPPTTMAISVTSKKAEVMKIPVLQEGIGGKDLSTIESLVSLEDV